MMFRIARRVIVYGGLGFALGFGAGCYLGNADIQLTDNSNTSKLEQIAGSIVITNPINNRRYTVDFDMKRLKSYDGQTQDTLRYQKDEQKLKELFE